MSAEFEARKHFAELYNEPLRDNDNFGCKRVEVDENHFDLKIEKYSSPKPAIEMRIYSPNTLIYRYKYKGDLTKPFNLATLYPIEPINIDD